MTPPTRPLGCGLTVLLPDLTISKSHTGEFTEGINGTYTITVTNVGQRVTVDTISVVDTLPTGLSYVSGSGAGWAVNAVGQIVTATYPNSLVASGNASFQIEVAVGAAAVPSVINRAHVSGGGEMNTANNSAVDPTDVNPPGGDSTAPAAIGDQLV